MDDRGRREYFNPPIEEGLCLVTFAEPLAWNVATPGQLFERVKAQYPSDPEAQEQVEASVQRGDAPTSANLSFNRGPQRYIYKDASASRLLLANPISVGVSSLRPYEGWPALRERLESALAAVGDVTQLKQVGMVSLRYINRIEIPGPAIDTDDYFHVRVRTAEDGHAYFRGFMHRVESILTDGVTLAKSTFATLESPPDVSTFLLDLDFQRPNLSISEAKDVISVADDLKRLENAEFESCITDATRELFA